MDKNLSWAPFENWKMWTCGLLLHSHMLAWGWSSDYVAEHTSAVGLHPLHYLFTFPVSSLRASEPLLHRISPLVHGTVFPPGRPEKC